MTQRVPPGVSRAAVTLLIATMARLVPGNGSRPATVPPNQRAQQQGVVIMDRKTIARRAILSAPIVVAAARTLPAASEVRISRDLLKAFLDTLSAYDLKAFRALYVDSSYVQHQALVTNAPSAISGPEAAVAYFQKRIEAFPDLKVTSDVSLFEGDMIAANLIWSGTHRGEYLGVPGTGRHVTFNSTDIMKVRGGQFSEHWGAADLFGLVSQLRS